MSKKVKSKSRPVEDDEDLVMQNEEEDVVDTKPTKSKKSKKGKKAVDDDDDIEAPTAPRDDEDDAPKSKSKSKGKKSKPVEDEEEPAEEVEDVPLPKTKSKKAKKSKKAADDGDDEVDVDPDADDPVPQPKEKSKKKAKKVESDLEEEEPAELDLPATKSKSKKKKTVTLAEPVSDAEEPEEPAPVVKKSSKKAKKSKEAASDDEDLEAQFAPAPLNSFDMLDGGDEAGSADEEGEDDESEPEPAPSKKKGSASKSKAAPPASEKKKSKKSKSQTEDDEDLDALMSSLDLKPKASAFAFGDNDDDVNDDDEDAAAEEEEEETPAPSKKSKSDKKSKQKKAKKFSDDDEDNADELEEPESAVAKPSKADSGKKKKAKKPVVEDEEDADEFESAPVPAPVSKSKDKKKDKKKIAADDDDDLDDLVADVEAAAPAPKAKDKKKDKKKEKAGKTEDDDDIDAILADVGVTPAPAPAGAAKGKDKKKDKGKAAAPATKAEDDIDTILADVGAAPAAAVEPSKGKDKGKTKGKDVAVASVDAAVDDVDAALADLGLESEPAAGAAAPPGGAQLSKAQLKRLRKKEQGDEPKDKAEEEKAKAAEKEKAEKEKADKDKGKKGKGKPTGALAALREQMAAQKAAEELAAKLEKERIAAEEAAEKKRIEDEKRAEEEAAARAAARAEARKQAKKDGLLKSKKDRDADLRKQQFLESLQAQGMEIPDKKQKPVYDKKKKGKAVDPSAGAAKTKQQRLAAEQKKRADEVKQAAESARLLKEDEQRRKDRDAAIESENRDIARLTELAEYPVSDMSSGPESDDETYKVASAAADEPEAKGVTASDAESWEDAGTGASGAVIDSWDALDGEDVDPLASKEEQELAQMKKDRERRREVRRQARADKAKARDTKRKEREEARKELADVYKRRAAREAAEEAYRAKRKEDEERRKREQEEAEMEAMRRQMDETATGEAAADDSRDGSEEEIDMENLRSPICCILGHVDTGKTKLLDKIRSTNVQEGEAGGITQQIGATYFPISAIKQQTAELNASLPKKFAYDIPGLLVIDTPGHESFTNLRSRGSNLCDIAILVVDIMHGLEPQTIESLNLLKARKTPFVVALNKIDRMYDWKAIPWSYTQKSLAQQPAHAVREFKERVAETKLAFQQQGLNCELYYDNKDFKSTVSLVPTSAITGEGVPDLLMLLVQLTQQRMSKRLTYISELQCTVLEVKVIDGLGTTIDVILVNGILRENDTIVICGLNGPIVTKIRALLTPQPLKEMRVKGDYIHHKIVKAAMGVKITAPGLEQAIAGSQLIVAGPNDDIEELKDEVMQDLATILARVDRSGQGVCVQASTLGSLEALLSFLETSKIPVSGIAIGPVHKKDVMRAAAMLEKKHDELAVILAFDVKVTPEAEQQAKDLGVKIFTANIIYHLFDKMTAYMEEVKKKKQEALAGEIVFPAILSIVPNCVFRQKDPIVIGVKITDGVLKIGTPLCIPAREKLMLGRVIGIQKNHQDVASAKAGEEVAVKVDDRHAGAITFGRHWLATDQIVSKLTRQSIDLLKENYKDELTRDEWQSVVTLKKLLDIK